MNSNRSLRQISKCNSPAPEIIQEPFPSELAVRRESDSTSLRTEPEAEIATEEENQQKQRETDIEKTLTD